jgi:lipoprotein-anchoring transpeptidase ErfK/SrfK
MVRFRAPLLGALLAAVLLFVSVPHAQAQGSRSIDVNLSTQTASVIEDGQVVYTAGVTTGRPGFRTPTGTFSILYRVANETMDSSSIGIPRDSPGGYYLTGVLYTQYFTSDGAALHYNYWSPASAFGGYPTSHGCVGMQLGPAQFFWNFASVGTPVTIHY